MILINNLNHTYRPRNSDPVSACKNFNLTIKNNEMAAFVGISGAGKSTVVKCISRLVEPDSGDIIINGESIVRCSEIKAQKIRRSIGMIFQNFNLLERSLVIDNVLLGRLGYISTLRSLLSRYAFNGKDHQLAIASLRKVGIEDLAYRRVDTLSGGQQQRVGIARVLAQEPKIILADEPVSNLDPMRKEEIMNLLQQIQKREKISMIISLHDIELAKKYSDRIIGMVKGEKIFDNAPEVLSKEKYMEIFT